MKRLSIVIFSVLVLLFISGCNNTTNGEVGQVPVYQGMTIYSSSDVLSSSFNDAILTSLNFNYNQDMSIEDAINEEIDTTTSDEVQYFAARNQDVFITVKLENPDSQVILRFTLNGTIYQSYQFQEGSDSENLILKVNAGDISGIKKFTIDEIKYIENVTNETKDAIIDGNQTVELGVTYDTIPFATIDSIDIHATSISFNVNVSDDSRLIEKSGNTLKAYLYDGNEIVRTIDLVVGSNEVIFDKLSIDMDYEYAIAAVYDTLDGIGKRVAILNQETIQTEKIMNISVSNQTQSTIEFILDINDEDEVGAITAIELYQGETLVEALTDLSEREFTGLLSNNEYTIKVTYTYDLNDGVGSQTLTINQAATTLAKAAPEVVIDNVVPSQDSVTFDITVTDTDEMGSITAIELYQGETLVEALTDLSEREFTGLLSNNEYTIKVTYTYDLNDGAGLQTLITSQAATTVAKATPVVAIDNVVPTQDSIGFGITVTDVDQVGAISAIELYKGETLVEALTDLSVREFSGLLSNNEYQIKVTYKYDLNDGNGLQLKIYNDVINTQILNGQGTLDSPYQIDNIDDLRNIVLLQNNYFVLTSDIDLSEVIWEPLTSFEGNFNGNGYSIIGLNMEGNYGDYTEGIGLFVSYNGTFENVNIVDVNINVVSLNVIKLGVIAGNFEGDLYNVNIDGNIVVTSISEMRVGGIAGLGNIDDARNIMIELNFNISNDSYTYFGGFLAEGEMNSSRLLYKGNVNISTTTGHIFAGGLIGITTLSTINDVFVDINLSAYGTEEKKLGGLIGLTNGSFTIDKSYTVGFIGNYDSNAYTYSGGLIGYIENPTGSSKIISNSISTIGIVHTGYSYAGNIYGNSRGGLLLNNVYRTDNQSVQDANMNFIDSIDVSNYNILRMQFEDLSNAVTYIDVLKWDINDFVFNESPYLD